MSLSMYDASVPVFVQGLEALSAVLDKGAAFAAARKIDPAVLIGCRLYPDMFPLTRQVQIAADFAKGTTARLAGHEVPKWLDDETSISELRERIARTLSYVREFDRSAIEGSQDREITLTIGGQPMTFTGRAYLMHFSLPNFWFHTGMAYAILRHNGVELGKRDFMGKW